MSRFISVFISRFRINIDCRFTSSNPLHFNSRIFFHTFQFSRSKNPIFHSFTPFVQPIYILPSQYQLSLRRGLCALKIEAVLSPKRELHIQENNNMDIGRRENFRYHYKATLPRHSTWLHIVCANSSTAVRLPQKNSCVRARIQKQELHARFIKTFRTTWLMRSFRVSTHQVVWPYRNVSHEHDSQNNAKLHLVINYKVM
jgi:hypothetical protein